MFVRAGAYLAGDRPAEGLRVIEEAIAVVGEDNLQFPDFTMLTGDLLLVLGDRDGAESRFATAFVAAKRQGLRIPQLRAATRLARLRGAANTQLREVYETFTEGFDAADLADARAVLGEVDARVG
jgi:hypothetical protein